MQLVKFNPHDTCPNCGKRFIEAYDKNSRPMSFSYAVENNRINELYSRGIYYFQCKNCKAKFLPEFFDENTIIPLRNKINVSRIMKHFVNKES